MTTLMIIHALVYWVAGYIATYMILRPQAFFDALSAGPGLSAAGWEYHNKHYKMTYPATAALFVVLVLVLLEIREVHG